jgi:hypothetical protein
MSVEVYRLSEVHASSAITAVGVGVYQHFPGTCYVHNQGDLRPGCGGSRYLRNVAQTSASLDGATTQKKPSLYLTTVRIFRGREVVFTLKIPITVAKWIHEF